MNREQCISICNGLLRGERAAVNTYNQALEKYSDRPEVLKELTRIRGEHAAAVRELERNIRSMGGMPDDASGAWGEIAGVVQATADLLGEWALESLQQGEKCGEYDYEKAVEDDDVMTGCKSMIRAKLLPAVREHIAALEWLQQAA